MTRQTLGYARVSSTSQSLDLQLDQLRAAGASRIFKEKASGSDIHCRDEFRRMIDYAREGDTILVTKLDRFARNTRDLLNTIHELEEKGVTLKVLDQGLDTGNKQSKLVISVLGMVAEMESDLIRERQRAGIERAKEKGVYAKPRNRKTTIDRQAVAQLKAEGKGVTEIAKALDISRQSVYRIENELGDVC